MATNLSGTPSFSGSATIYTFPPRGRFALRIDDTAPAANVQLPHGAKLVTGSSWYHDEAIQAEKPRKN
jgi:Protein of unknown function (DUF2735)